MNDLRIDERDQPWPTRPWLMALLCALAGFAFWTLVDDGNAGRGAAAAASGVAVATIALALTIELRRWAWAIGFAVGWGIVIALIAYMAAGYGRVQTIAEWPFFSGIFAVLLAAPLFQAARDHGTLRFPAAAAHDHVWTDAVIGAASVAFVAISWLLAWLIASLFKLIGLGFLEQLLESGWFGSLLIGAAFGGAIGLLRERDALVATLHRLAMVVLSVLAPLLAVALLLFLASLPFTGLGGLWDGWVSAAALMLTAGAGALILGNAAIGPGDARPHRVFRWSAMALALVILPLALLAALAMGLRIGQYGWTPERIWGVLAAGVAIVIGVAGWWAVLREQLGFTRRWQQAQVHIGMGVCAIALFLALPIVDFGAISARDQVARLKDGRVNAVQFDYAAMAFDFGPAGRAALRRLAAGDNAVIARQARAALASEFRYTADQEVQTAVMAERIDTALRIEGGGPVPPDARQRIIETRLCGAGRCIARWVDSRRIILIGRRHADADVEGLVVIRDRDGSWRQQALVDATNADPAESPTDLATARIGLQPVMRQQVVVDGRVLGELPAGE